MGPFELAAIIIITVFGSKTLTAWLTTRRGNSASQKKIQDLEGRIQALESGHSVNALESRLHVLEEIVTTDEFELQQKFRQLEQENSESGAAPSQSTGRPR